MSEQVSQNEWTDSVLHLYGQAAWHDDAYIAGSKGALIELRDMLTEAIESGRGLTQFFANDGEGYCIGITVIPDERVADLRLPYTDEIAREHPDGSKYGPWTILEDDTP